MHRLHNNPKPQPLNPTNRQLAKSLQQN